MTARFAIRVLPLAGRPIAAALLLLCASCGDDAVVEKHAEMKMLVIGFDGLDPVLLQRLMDEGRMPNFKKLAGQGTFCPLATAMPPQSPVAWANVICGGDPGVHQIYDFIHRKPDPPGDDPIEPYLSISEIQPMPRTWYEKLFWEYRDWGDCRIRFSGGQRPVSFRRGPEFWDALVAAGVDTTIYRMPANYPPPADVKGATFRCLCGMGTVDLLGSEGTFTAYLETPGQWDPPLGGRIVELSFDDHRAVSEIEGPPNSLKVPDQDGRLPLLSAPVEIVRDPVERSAKIRIGDATVVLRQGEWSDWVRFRFEIGCFGQTISTIVKLYLKQVHPTLSLYVTPMQMDPQNPALPISTPAEFAAEVAATTGGGMYTTSIPEQSEGKALRARRPQVLNEDEFLEAVRRLVDERTKHYRHALASFKRGFLFFYFGHTDQLAHIFWGDMDPQNPAVPEEQRGKYDKVIEKVYVEADALLGEAFQVIDDNDVLIAMSDHGFASFRRGFNLNTWLNKKGYLSIRSTGREARRDYRNIEFEETEAYAVGINSLYINLQGREKFGIVLPEEKRALMEEIAGELVQVRDDDGSVVIDKVYIVEDEYPGADPQLAPDILVGYARNYRGSWATALGGQPTRLIENNTDRWSGDHCIAAHLVPGVLLVNRGLAVEDPTLSDIAPSVLHAFGVKLPAGMKGRNLFAPAGGVAADEAKRNGRG